MFISRAVRTLRGVVRGKSMYDLYIANKNYSSWSLRPWVLMRELKIAFREHMVVFGDESSWQSYRKISPAGKVPCVVDGDIVVWESLAIMEFLAERHAGVWPAPAAARAWARSAAAEMHAGFGELRSRCSMGCGASAVPILRERRLPRSTPSTRRWRSGSRVMG